MKPDTAEVNPTGQKVFICYRREEASAHAGRLYDAMVARFGESNVFMDIDIAPGVDFVERITEVVSRCLVLIVVMGPRWATVKDDDSNVRLSDPDDFVRLEVETGLSRSDVTPIPTLVGGAQMPRREDLPEELRPLTRRNAVELSDGRWAYDVGRLNGALDDLLGNTAAPPPAPPTPDPAPPQQTSAAAEEPAPSRAVTAASPKQTILEGAALAAAAGFLARGAANLIDPPDTTADQIAKAVLRGGEIWAVVAAVLCAWLAYRAGRSALVRPALRGLFLGAIAGGIGGAIWAAPKYLPATNLTASETDPYEALSMMFTGGVLGAMIGARWRPRARGAGLLSGVVAGGVSQVVLNMLGWVKPPPLNASLGFAWMAAAIAALTLATLLALDRQRSGVRTAAAVSSADP